MICMIGNIRIDEQYILLIMITNVYFLILLRECYPNITSIS